MLSMRAGRIDVRSKVSPTPLDPAQFVSNTTGFAPVIQLLSLDGSDGFHLDCVAALDISGKTVASTGDVNGDWGFRRAAG